MIDRKTLLNKVVQGSSWTFPDNTKNYKVIKENINYIKHKLCLDSLEKEIQLLINDVDNHDKLSHWITTRQRHLIFSIRNNVKNRNFQGAYHELYDFIEGMRGLPIDKPIDLIERIIIKDAIIQIEGIIGEKTMSDTLKINLDYNDTPQWNNEYKSQIVEVKIIL